METLARDIILTIFDALSKDVEYKYLKVDFKPLARKELVKSLQRMSEKEAKEKLITTANIMLPYLQREGIIR